MQYLAMTINYKANGTWRCFLPRSIVIAPCCILVPAEPTVLGSRRSIAYIRCKWRTTGALRWVGRCGAIRTAVRGSTGIEVAPAHTGVSWTILKFFPCSSDLENQVYGL